MCTCHSVEHQLLVTDWDLENDKYDLPYLIVEMYLTKHRFFRRLIHGIRYILGYQCKFGAFEEMLLEVGEAKRLRDVLNKFITQHDIDL